MKLIPVLLLIALSVSSCGIYPFTVTRSQEKEHYPGGEIKTITYSRTTSYRSQDVMTLYRRTIRSTHEYYPGSILKLYKRVITRQGDGGGSCFYEKEISSHYNPDGILVKKVTMRCDGRKVITRHYTPSGKVKLIQIDRQFR